LLLPAIAVPRVDGRRHPLAAAYRVTVREEAVKLLATRRAGPVHLYDTVPTRYLGPEAFADVDATCESLRNINTPEEYAAILRERG
jgi:molybdopterin-guanine dinucleotide biosynthesis protein A